VSDEDTDDKIEGSETLILEFRAVVLTADITSWVTLKTE
jgi:hypothetical protein